MAIIRKHGSGAASGGQRDTAILRALAWIMRKLWAGTVILFRFLRKHLVTRTTRNIGVFGDVATGKTVFLTMLLQELQNMPDGDWEFAPDKHHQVHEYVRKNFDGFLSKEEWPPGTPKGAWRDLAFTLLHVDNRTRLKIECSDTSGEDLRDLVQEAQSEGTTVSEHAERLNAFFHGCDHYLFLINGEKLEYADRAIQDNRDNDDVRYKNTAQRLYQDVVDWLEVLNETERETERSATVIFTAADQASIGKMIGSSQLRAAASKFSQKHLAQSHKRLVRYFEDVEFTGVSAVGEVKRDGAGHTVPDIFARKDKINIVPEFLHEADSLRDDVRQERKRKRIAQSLLGGAAALFVGALIVNSVLSSRWQRRLREAGEALVRGDHLRSSGDLAGSRREYARARVTLPDWVEHARGLALPRHVNSPTGARLALVDDGDASGGSRPFYAGATETTRAEFEGYLKASGRAPPKEFERLGTFAPDPNSPVVFVSWEDANAFCAWLTERARSRAATRTLKDADLQVLDGLRVKCVGLSGHSEYRLPTVEEWQRLGGAGDGRSYPWGGTAPGNGFCNLKGSSDSYRYTSPVGALASGASPFGCHDVIGNVWEWCLDKKGPVLDASTGSRFNRAICGGAWNTSPAAVVLSTVKRVPEASRTDVIGFRYVLAPVRRE